MNINLKNGEKFIIYKALLPDGYNIYLSQYESEHAMIEMFKRKIDDNDDMNKGIKLFT